MLQAQRQRVRERGVREREREREREGGGQKEMRERKGGWEGRKERESPVSDTTMACIIINLFMCLWYQH